MAHSLLCTYIHVIFHVKTTSPVIREDDLPSLHAYLAATVWEACTGLHPQIGGTNNHVHILCNMPKTLTVPALVNRLKVASHQYLGRQGDYYQYFAWQSGYGAFSVSPTNITPVRRYIQHQREHHRQTTPKEEYLALLHACGIEPKEVPYLLAD